MEGGKYMEKNLFVPGRTELAGNHTDHQQGRILASAVDLGLYADFEKNGENAIHIHSEGYSDFTVRLNHTAVRTGEFGTPKSLVRGMVAAFRELGLNCGGFNAEIRTTLPAGSGLSSSAAYTVLIGKILSELFNDGKVDPVVIARAAQQSENKYFGKPCGLMDQMVLTLILTPPGVCPSGLDTSYARIPADMVYIANLFDKGVLGDVDPEEFRRKGWDPANRPVRRAMHFFNENERVPLMRDALKRGDGATYMRLMNESGRSSEELLNNIITSATGDTKLAQGLDRSRKLLEGKGAWRVHGGGFAGCVQALMPTDFFPTYRENMEKAFGGGSCREIRLV